MYCLDSHILATLCSVQNCVIVVNCLSNALDRLCLQFFRLCVRVSVNRSVVERLRQQFFIEFHQILYAVQKCGRIDAYCLLGKRKVEIRFQRGANYMFLSITSVVECLRLLFFTKLHQILRVAEN